MKKERIIEFCVDNLILSALLIAFICILCGTFGDIDSDFVECKMSKILFCCVTTAFCIFITYVFYGFKKFNKKPQRLLSCLNGITTLMVIFIFSKEYYKELIYTYIYIETKHLIYIFIILSLSYMAVRYELRNKGE